MRTPSLGRRVVVAGVVVVALLALALDVLLYVVLHSNERADVKRALQRDTELVEQEARFNDPEDLPLRLAELGVIASLRDPEGNPAPGQPALRLEGNDTLEVRTVSLPGGWTATVGTPTEEADRTLRRLLALELFTTPLVIILAALLLRLIAEIAMRPLDAIASAARRTAEGSRGERLRPDRIDTRLGQMADAYDEMLDALESAVTDAEAARAMSDLLLQRNHRIIETAPEAFVAVNEDRVICEWNAEAERIFGWPRDEAVGRHLIGTVLPADEDDEDGGLERFWSTGTDTRQERVVELIALHRDGHRFPARMTVWSTRHGGSSTVSAFMWDVTEQLKAEKAVSQLAAIVRSADEAMLSTTLQGTILTWNEAAERMYGYAVHEAVGLPLSIIVPEEARLQADRLLESVRQGEPVLRTEMPAQRKDGSVIQTAVTVSPVLDHADGVYAASLIARDITEERWISLQLDRSLDALVVAAEEARASEAATRQFLDDAAHQLRAPITSVRACAEGLLRPMDPETREELLGALVRETARAGRLIGGLLRMARLNQGHELDRHPCDLVALCRQEVARVQERAPLLRVTVDEVGETPIGAPQLDHEAIAEVLANLLDNARRHATSRIDVVLSCGRGAVEVSVADDGPGLPDGLVASAFSRFVSLDGKGGSGLGLPIARQLAQAHGGDVTYRDGTFVLQLPPDATPADTETRVTTEVG